MFWCDEICYKESFSGLWMDWITSNTINQELGKSCSNLNWGLSEMPAQDKKDIWYDSYKHNEY